MKQQVSHQYTSSVHILCLNNTRTLKKFSFIRFCIKANNTLDRFMVKHEAFYFKYCRWRKYGIQTHWINYWWKMQKWRGNSTIPSKKENYSQSRTVIQTQTPHQLILALYCPIALTFSLYSVWLGWVQHWSMRNTTNQYLKFLMTVKFKDSINLRNPKSKGELQKSLNPSASLEEKRRVRTGWNGLRPPSQLQLNIYLHSHVMQKCKH